MRFPFTEVGPGLFRPVVPVISWGATRCIFVDGVIDTAADWTLLPPDRAVRLGIDRTKLPGGPSIRSATGQLVSCKTTRLPFELRRDGERCCWLADLAVTGPEVTVPHWGMRG